MQFLLTSAVVVDAPLQALLAVIRADAQNEPQEVGWRGVYHAFLPAVAALTAVPAVTKSLSHFGSSWVSRTRCSPAYPRWRPSSRSTYSAS